MRIVDYISLVLVVLALIWLVVSAIRSMKGYKKIIISMAKKAEKVRESTESIKKEQVQITKTVNSLNETYQNSVDQTKKVISEGQTLIQTLKTSGAELKNNLPKRFRI